MKKIKFIVVIGIVVFALYSFTTFVQNEWIVPAKYEKMQNPIPASQDMAIGKSLYAKHCQSCHGKKGLGDGNKADEVDGDLGDFSSKEFQAQSDGALFYKSYIGRDDMPNYEKKMPDQEDVWLVVNYVRTLGN
jgi:mono/diheme cytochrome c family protein